MAVNVNKAAFCRVQSNRQTEWQTKVFFSNAQRESILKDFLMFTFIIDFRLKKCANDVYQDSFCAAKSIEICYDSRFRNLTSWLRSSSIIVVCCVTVCCLPISCMNDVRVASYVRYLIQLRVDMLLIIIVICLHSNSERSMIISWIVHWPHVSDLFTSVCLSSWTGSIRCHQATRSITPLLIDRAVNCYTVHLNAKSFVMCAHAF